MNAPATITGAIPLLDLDAACQRLNEWRGHMVENFARCEQAVTETLAALNSAGAEAKGAKFPHLVGQRYERLAAILSAPAGQSGHRKAALSAVDRFRNHDGLRAMLCHGVTKVAVDRAGEWVALMTMTSFKASATTTTRITITEAGGRALLSQVMDERRRTCAALGQVRRELATAG